MIDKLKEFFENKKILLLGFGREGRSTYKFIRKYYPDLVIYIADRNLDLVNDLLIINDKNIKLILGDNYLDEVCDKYDVIMKSPGISLKNFDYSKLTNISSELELFIKYFPGKSIGVTGTKGKSTTSTLLYNVVKEQYSNTLFGGNIGIPVFDLIDDVKEDTIAILEMGVHQLQFMDVSPNISIFLNIFEEHLDHYKDYNDYIDSKCNIFRHQKDGDVVIYNDDFSLIKERVLKYNNKNKKISVSYNGDASISIKNSKVVMNGEDLYDTSSSRCLVGEHNLNNIMFILGVVKLLGLDLKKAHEIINSFKGLKHRLELVGTFDGVSYYNDSISTIPMATINALKALPNTNTLIVGGMDRGIDYTLLINYLNDNYIGNLVLMPDTGKRIIKDINSSNIKIYEVKDLKEAVCVSKKITCKGSVCLMSPAAASYGFFKNFEERGDKFIEYIKEPSC